MDTSYRILSQSRRSRHLAVKSDWHKPWLWSVTGFLGPGIFRPKAEKCQNNCTKTIKISNCQRPYSSTRALMLFWHFWSKSEYYWGLVISDELIINLWINHNPPRIIKKTFKLIKKPVELIKNKEKKFSNHTATRCAFCFRLLALRRSDRAKWLEKQKK